MTTQKYGGGFNALGEVEIAGNSTVNISNSYAETGVGGGFDTEKGLKLSNGLKTHQFGMRLLEILEEDSTTRARP